MTALSGLGGRGRPIPDFIRFPFCEHGSSSVTCPVIFETGEPGAPPAVRNM